MSIERVEPSRYNIHLEDRFDALRLIDIPAEAARHQPWFNETLTAVNEALVRLGIFQGEFHCTSTTSRTSSFWSFPEPSSSTSKARGR